MSKEKPTPRYQFNRPAPFTIISSASNNGLSKVIRPNKIKTVSDSIVFIFIEEDYKLIHLKCRMLRISFQNCICNIEDCF